MAYPASSPSRATSTIDETDGDPNYPDPNIGFDTIRVAELTLGSPYCVPAIPNSTGFPAHVVASGSLDVAANNVTLAASDLPPAQFGYFLTSQTQGCFNPPGSNGFICLSGAIGRYNQPQNVIVGPTGSIQIDLTAVPQPSGYVAVLPGDTWNFQCWYRDLGNANNFTDAVAVTFQ